MPGCPVALLGEESLRTRRRGPSADDAAMLSASSWRLRSRSRGPRRRLRPGEQRRPARWRRLCRDGGRRRSAAAAGAGDDQYWTPRTRRRASTTVGDAPKFAQTDGADVWASNVQADTVARVRASDGRARSRPGREASASTSSRRWADVLVRGRSRGQAVSDRPGLRRRRQRWRHDLGRARRAASPSTATGSGRHGRHGGRSRSSTSWTPGRLDRHDGDAGFTSPEEPTSRRDRRATAPRRTTSLSSARRGRPTGARRSAHAARRPSWTASTHRCRSSATDTASTLSGPRLAGRRGNFRSPAPATAATLERPRRTCRSSKPRPDAAVHPDGLRPLDGRWDRRANLARWPRVAPRAA